jgi:hypothetical protein
LGFLWQALSAGRAVQLELDTGTPDPYFATVVEMIFSDNNANHRRDPGEQSWIAYFGPDDPFQQRGGILQDNLAGSRLQFLYSNFTIEAAYFSSIPEPTVFSLLALGIVAVLRRRR